MKLILNGTTLEDQDHFDLRVEIDSAGETVAPGKITFAGGTLTFRGATAFEITNDKDGGYLFLHGESTALFIYSSDPPQDPSNPTFGPSVVTVRADDHYNSLIHQITPIERGPDDDPAPDRVVIVEAERPE